MERESVTKSQKGNKAYVERKVGVFSVEGTWTMFQEQGETVSLTAVCLMR